MAPMKDPTHYETLEIDPDADLLTIKKAYRRLALLHHPDRNNGSSESTERFKRISEAYEVLSDPTQRRRYDVSLANGSNMASSTMQHSVPSSPGVDPFARFNDLFRNDPFFHEAFDGMDDEFASRFQDSTGDSTNRSSSSVGWIPWILQKCGIDFQMTTYTSTPQGVTATSYASRPSQSSSRQSNYTNKHTRTLVDSQRRQVTIRSMERNGNKLEERYINNKLVERRVNGVVENIRIQS